VDCEPMSLIEKLGHEKDLTGIYLSGHPLDHYQFEIKNYGITPINDLLEFKESIKSQPNPGRAFKILALIVEANHKIAKSGNKYGSFVIEDFTGRTDFMLFSEDFLRLSPMLVKGASVMINCYFRQHYNR
ncbi:MAG TPA: DNA polymerase III subunit alpha, partial [Chitinophagaceae bacterium]|nr:DNA polymerase III subunit alpha [Chitinophagaceae bacterium]